MVTFNNLWFTNIYSLRCEEIALGSRNVLLLNKIIAWMQQSNVAYGIRKIHRLASHA